MYFSLNVLAWVQWNNQLDTIIFSHKQCLRAYRVALGVILEAAGD